MTLREFIQAKAEEHGLTIDEGTANFAFWVAVGWQERVATKQSEMLAEARQKLRALEAVLNPQP